MPEGFLKRLRTQIKEDVLEANKQFEPKKSFCLSCENTLEIQVNRKRKGEDENEAFVLFKLIDDVSLSVSYHCRNGGRARYSEKPLGKIVLKWDGVAHECVTELCGKNLSMVDLRRETLGQLFFD